MNEQIWLTSTDPAAMLFSVKDIVTRRQMKFIEQAGFNQPDFRLDAGGNLLRDCQILREIVGNPFIRIGWRVDPRQHLSLTPLDKTWHKQADTWKYDPPEVQLDPAILTWRDSTIPHMARKIAGVCPTCEGNSFRTFKDGFAAPLVARCHECNGTGYISEPEWRDLPELADALEMAGCGEKAILDHLRREGGHCRGCFALELFLEAGR